MDIKEKWIKLFDPRYACFKKFEYCDFTSVIYESEHLIHSRATTHELKHFII